MKWVARLAIVAMVAALTFASVRWYEQLRDSARLGGDALAAVTLYPGTQGIRLPEVSGRDLQGRPLSATSFRGHVLVLNVWGSWCGPCNAEAPSLARVSAANFRKGVRFMGIDIRDALPAALAFERAYGISYPSVNDPAGIALVQLDGILPIGAVPATIVVDKAGLIRARVIGKTDQIMLQGMIDDAQVGR